MTNVCGSVSRASAKPGKTVIPPFYAESPDRSGRAIHGIRSTLFPFPVHATNRGAAGCFYGALAAPLLLLPGIDPIGVALVLVCLVLIEIVARKV